MTLYGELLHHINTASSSATAAVDDGRYSHRNEVIAATDRRHNDRDSLRADGVDQ